MLMAQLAGALSSSVSLPMFLFAGSVLAESEVFKSSVSVVVCFSLVLLVLRPVFETVLCGVWTSRITASS